MLEFLTDECFASKQKKLRNLEAKLTLFCNKTEKIKPTNENHEKDIENRKVVLDKAFKLCNPLLKLYADQFNKLECDKKKKDEIGLG